MNALDYLATLDATRRNAALGTLRVGAHYGIHLYAGESPVGTTLQAADAELIVAAVNALPKLTRALQEVLALTDELWPREIRRRRPHSFRSRLRSVVDESLGADQSTRRGTVKVGQPWKAADQPDLVGPLCQERSPDELRFYCCRSHPHPEPHIAGNGRAVVAVWS